jgi:hypothetical protein
VFSSFRVLHLPAEVPVGSYHVIKLQRIRDTLEQVTEMGGLFSVLLTPILPKCVDGIYCRFRSGTYLVTLVLLLYLPASKQSLGIQDSDQTVIDVEIRVSQTLHPSSQRRHQGAQAVSLRPDLVQVSCSQDLREKADGFEQHSVKSVGQETQSE